MKIKITLLFNTHSNIFHTACLKYFKAACYVYGYCEIEKESGRNTYGTVHMQRPTREFEFEATLVHSSVSTRTRGHDDSIVSGEHSQCHSSTCTQVLPRECLTCLQYIRVLP